MAVSASALPQPGLTPAPDPARSLDQTLDPACSLVPALDPTWPLDTTLELTRPFDDLAAEIGSDAARRLWSALRAGKEVASLGCGDVLGEDLSFWIYILSTSIDIYHDRSVLFLCKYNYVYLDIYIDVCIYQYRCIDVSMYTYTYTYARTYTYVNAYMHV